MFNVFSSAAKVMSAAGIMLMEGMGGGKLPGNWSGQIKDAVNEGRDRVQDALSEGGDNLKDARDDAKTAAEKKAAEWGYGIDDFEGIGGCKGGPIDGFVKVMQMMVFVLLFLFSPFPFFHFTLQKPSTDINLPHKILFRTQKLISLHFIHFECANHLSTTCRFALTHSSGIMLFHFQAHLEFANWNTLPTQP